MFVDMDDLKYINDRFGHNEGDFALKTIAKALKHVSDEDKQQFAARFGGDEFILFAAETNDENAKDISKRIDSYLDNINETAGKPYEIHASIGYHIATANKTQSLYNLISFADQIMYDNKKKRKAERKQKQS